MNQVHNHGCECDAAEQKSVDLILFTNYKTINSKAHSFH